MRIFRHKKSSKMSDKHSVQKKACKDSNPSNEPPNEPLNKQLRENIKNIRVKSGNSTDIVIHNICIGKNGNIQLAIVYTNGLADTKSVNDFILKPLLNFSEIEDQTSKSNLNILQLLKQSVILSGDIQDLNDFGKLIIAIMSGDTVVLVDGYDRGFIIGMRGWQERGVTEPTTQTVIRGPKEGFSENIATNIALIRRKIKNPNLYLETKQIGKVTNTNVAIMFIKEIANEKVVQEVRDRLDRIHIDGILESGYIEEMIRDEAYSPFPTIYNTERPDVIAAGLLEGRIAILVDGTPFVLQVPALFVQFFQSADDYYQSSLTGSLLRILRFIALFISLFAPSLYIAISTFHQEMIPTQLLFNLAAQREGIPFPAFVEALIMEITFEVLREAGLRMPRAVGQAVSIVGTLVIGQAAVEAGIVSAAMVIVVSITAISSFVTPIYDMGFSIRVLRFFFMAGAATLGLFGIIITILLMVLHLCSLRSFGIPYLTPFAPFVMNDQKDAMVRLPIWKSISRPRLLNQRNVRRESTSRPSPQVDEQN